MAKKEQIRILKQGSKAWNDWRSNNPAVVPDLTEADLRKVDLFRANLYGALLSGANLDEANLAGNTFNKADLHNASLKRAIVLQANFREANLRGAHLQGANLTNTDFIKADLDGVRLMGANLTNANLTNANLNGAHLEGVNLTYANLTNAEFNYSDLTGANLTNTNLTKAYFTNTVLIGLKLIETNFKGARMANTVIGNDDLSKSIGLGEVLHSAPSILSSDSIRLSSGKIPEAFLRGCGLSDWEIESVKLYDPELSNHEIDEILYKMHDLRAQQPLQISPLFISYSHTDSSFVDKLEALLNEKGIRFWRDIHRATSGKLEKQIDLAIRQNPTVLLILSESSIKSDWVQHEVRKAREVEKELKHDVLCPVALDDSWKKSQWPERIMEQVMEYNILDFSIWRDDAKLAKLFGKLVDGLDLYYKK